MAIKINGLERWRGEVSAKLDNLVEHIGSLRVTIEKNAARFEGTLDQHKMRMDKLEMQHAGISVKLAVVIAAGAGVFAVVGKALADYVFLH